MIGASAFAVFALGMRHGADPDHLAAIDNLTRNAYARRPGFSRFVGTLFAAGHSVMVLAIAALVGLFGTTLGVHGALIETIGTWLSIVVLFAMAAYNLRALRSGGTRPLGLRTRLLPARLRLGTSPLLALPTGLLFGFGFETSSQIATYAVAFGTNAGVVGAVLIGGLFCLGMLVTDTLDSMLVQRLVAVRTTAAPVAMRIWLWTVTSMAVVVACYELAQVTGWSSPVSDLTVSAGLVGALLLVFIYVFTATRRPSDAADHPASIKETA